MGIRTRRQPTKIATALSEILGAAAVCAPITFLGVLSAGAQALSPSVLVADIPAQPLAKALVALANQTGLQLVYVSDIVRDQTSHAVGAGVSAQSALARMLQGTGLNFEYLTEHSIRILGVASSPKSEMRSDGSALQQIIVTANRRNEALQDVPMTIQVLTNATLEKLNVTTFDDFVSYLPGVTAHGVGPAQNNIYIRGLATGEFPNQASGINGLFPNVAIYLDEQSAQMPGRNLDIYAADLDRIEVLEGPQGTLFGAGAEAGVLRYITNKPKLNVTEATVNAGYAATAHGDPSGALDAVINIPLIADTLAVRGVIYSERRGGYLDNTPATFARAATDLSIGNAGADGQVPANSVVINNAGLAAANINSVTYQGVRLGVLYRLNEDWNALLTQSYQSIDAQGVFAEMAANSLGQPQPDLTVQLFNPSYNKDKFENTAVTVDGRIAALKVIYAGSYLVRNMDQQQDYTNYTRTGPYIDYYQCVNPGATAATAKCFSPSSFWRVQERNTHLSQELRFSAPDGWRIRSVGGLFYEDYKIYDRSDWYYLTAVPYFNPIATPTGYYVAGGKPVCGCPPPSDALFVPQTPTSIEPGVRPLGDGYFNDITRGYTQKAAYASVDVDIVPRALTVTAGTRYFSTNTWEVGSVVGSYGCQLLYDAPVPNPCINRESKNINSLGLDRTFSGFRSRASLSWKVNEVALLYYTWSQGFRSGSFNRGAFLPSGVSPLVEGPGSWQAQANLHGSWSAPLTAAPDNLTNNEIGWKTGWFEQRLQWVGAFYQENWDHAQVDASDPQLFGGGGGTINGGNFRVRGMEMSIVSRLASGLSVSVGAAWSHSELVKQGQFFWSDGTPIDFNTLVTSTGAKLPNPSGPLGSPLAGAPPFQGNIHMRYETNYRGYDAFAQIGAVHQAHSLASTFLVAPDLQGNAAAYDLPAFTTYDAALGAGANGWTLQLYGANLTDTRAQLYANDTLSYKAVTVNRPRTLGLRMSYKFRGS